MRTQSRLQAKIESNTTYFTGKPCINGHISKRVTANGSCVKCKEESRRRAGIKEKSNARMMAIESGERTYFSKKPCKNGHMAHRYTGSGECVVCSIKKREKHQEKIRNCPIEKARRSEYVKANRGLYVYHCQSRRKKTKVATPDWLSPEQIDEMKSIYNDCAKFNCYNKNSHHVDHIIPLSGDNVCGLHVPWNLQILTRDENLKKLNKVSL